MKRRTKKAAVAVLAAGGVLYGAGFVDGMAGAQELELNPAVEAPVSYRVGDTLVQSTRTRNPSCSVTRVFVNKSPVRMLVDARMEWDGQAGNLPVYPRVGDSAYTGATWLEPDEQITAVWTNTDFIPEGEVRILFEGRLTETGIGATHVEFIPACRVPAGPIVGPPVSPVDPPLVSVPSSPVEQVPGPVVPSSPPVPVDPGPAPSTTTTAALCTAGCGEAGTVEVLTSSIGPRRELAHTGVETWHLAVLGAGLLAVGWSLTRGAGRLSGREVEMVPFPEGDRD